MSEDSHDGDHSNDKVCFSSVAMCGKLQHDARNIADHRDKHILRASLLFSRNFADHRDKHAFPASPFFSCWLTYCYFSVPCTFARTIGGDHWKCQQIVVVGITRNN